MTHISSRLLMLWELAKHLGGSIPDTWNKYLFRRFWGEGALSSESYLVLENYQDVGLSHSLRFVGDLPRPAKPQDLIDAEITYGKLSRTAPPLRGSPILRLRGSALRLS